MKNYITIFLLATILLQSCWQKTSVPIELAVDKGRVKLISTNSKKIYFDKIIKEDSTFYGTKNSTGYQNKYEIPRNLVESIYLINKKGPIELVGL